MGFFDPFQFFFGSKSSSAQSQTPRPASYWHTPTSAEIAAAVAPDPNRYAPVDLTKSSCDDPYDPEDLYYYTSPKNGQGPYIPQLNDEEMNKVSKQIFIKRYGRSPDRASFIVWNKGTVPKTIATGCVTPDLGGYFGVQVDGKNKVIIDAYNTTFPNPPTPVPPKTKYFYYIRFTNRSTDEKYQPRRFTLTFRYSLKLNKNSKISCDDLKNDKCWGNLQKIPNTNAMGFVIHDTNVDYVRVDEANNAIIEAYNTSSMPSSSASSSSSNLAPAPVAGPAAPAPPSAAPPSAAPPSAAPPSADPPVAAAPAPVAAQTPSLPPLPPGWEELKEPSGRIYYGNPSLKIVQYERPILFEMGGQTFSSTKELLNRVKSTCTTQTCEIKLDPVAGGSKNKKHRRGTKRRHKASRRKASRRRTGKK